MADYGLRIRNASGVYTLTPDDRITRIIGSVNTGTSNGSRSADLADGAPFYFIVPDLNSGGAFVNIHVTIDSTRVAWVFESGGSRKPFDIFYGLY